MPAKHPKNAGMIVFMMPSMCCLLALICAAFLSVGSNVIGVESGITVTAFSGARACSFLIDRMLLLFSTLVFNMFLRSWGWMCISNACFVDKGE